MPKNRKLIESGTILYLREHTSEMQKLRYTIIGIVIVLILFIVWIIITERIAFPIRILRQYVAKC